MSAAIASQPGVVARPGGPCVAGTRITIYDILDYLHDDWPPRLIASWLNLTSEEMDAALGYIEAHRSEVEAQYREVVRHAEENRAYWEERNRERRARIDAAAERDRDNPLRARIRRERERLGL